MFSISHILELGRDMQMYYATYCRQKNISGILTLPHLVRVQNRLFMFSKNSMTVNVYQIHFLNNFAM